MANTRDLALSIFPLKCMIYGETGVGKTLLSSTFPAGYIIDTEGGLKTLQGLDREYDTVFEVDRLKPTAFQEIVKLVETKGKELTADQTLIIDSYTIVNEYAINRADALMGFKTDGDAAYAKWRQVLTLMLDLTDKLIRLKCNVVCTAHEEVFQDKLVGSIKTKPFFTGQSQIRIPHKFDELYRLAVNVSKKHVIQTHKSERLDAKSRLNREGVIPDEVTWIWSEKSPDSNPIFEILKKADEAAKGEVKKA